MAGGLVKYRHLSRNSAHRQALLRNLVTALVDRESIHTTWPKAKEAQRLAEKLITLAKRNNETSRRKVQGILYTPHDLMPKVFTTLRERYLNRPGGYTRVLRTQPKSLYNQGDSAILQFVDGPRDLRFTMTAAAVARDRQLKRPSNELTLLNRAKVIRYRHDGETEFDNLVQRVESLGLDANRGVRWTAGSNWAQRTVKGSEVAMTGGKEDGLPAPKRKARSMVKKTQEVNLEDCEVKPDGTIITPQGQRIRPEDIKA